MNPRYPQEPATRDGFHEKYLPAQFTRPPIFWLEVQVLDCFLYGSFAEYMEAQRRLREFSRRAA